MKKIVGIIVILLALLIILFPVFFKSSKNSGKVKVYVFEAGGCSACEEEIEYLKSLSSYNTKFEIVEKELYVDNESFEPGKDYELGDKVAVEFQKRGFYYADIEGTPFIVISNIYAASSFNDDLEDYINKAYDEGGLDTVACLEKGEENCFEVNDGSGIVKVILLVIFVAGVVSYIIAKRNKEDINGFDDNERELSTNKDIKEFKTKKEKAKRSSKNKKTKSK